jgi:hypothetical protein
MFPTDGHIGSAPRMRGTGENREGLLNEDVLALDAETLGFVGL